MKRFYRILPVVIAVALCAASANAELVLVKLKAAALFPDEEGNLTSFKLTEGTLIEVCAADQVPPADPDTLAAVFDTVTGDFLIVNKSDGSVVCPAPLRFTGGSTVPNAQATKQVRHAFLEDAESTEIVGSALGKVSADFDDLGALLKYAWKAEIQGSLQVDLLGGGVIVIGKLSTGNLFAPEGI